MKSKIMKLLLARSEYDDPVKHYVKNVSIPNFILHCGAHLGEEYKNYKELGINEIFWNEAQPILVDKLVQLFGKKHVFPGVLSNKEGDLIDFYLTDNSLSSSTRVIDPINKWNIKVKDKIVLKSITLDSILREIKIHKNHLPNLIILDLQGGEAEALEKSEIALLNHSDFVVEMSQYKIYKNQKLEQDIIIFFQNFGYILVYPKNRKTHYDALFLSPSSQKKYFRKISVFKRYLSLRKSKLIDYIYIIKKFTQ